MDLIVYGAPRAAADVVVHADAAFVKELQRQFSPPTVKQHLVALRMLFDWLVTIKLPLAYLQPAVQIVSTSLGSVPPEYKTSMG